MKRGASLVTTTLFVLVIIVAGISFYYFFIKEDINDILNKEFQSYNIISQEETDNGYRIHLYSNDLIDVCGQQLKRGNTIVYINGNAVHPMKEEDISELVNGEIENIRFMEEYPSSSDCKINGVYEVTVKLNKSYTVDNQKITHSQIIINKFGEIFYRLNGYYEEVDPENVPEFFKQEGTKSIKKFVILSTGIGGES